MKSRMLNSIVVMAIFVVLAVPTIIAAQTEQEQHNNQPVLNLDTLEDTNTIAECIGDASSGIADTRPDANTLHWYGQCGIDPSTHKLSGFCVGFGIDCLSRFNPQQCPVGAKPKTRCSRNNRCPPSYVDCGRPSCLIR